MTYLLRPDPGSGNARAEEGRQFQLDGHAKLFPRTGIGAESGVPVKPDELSTSEMLRQVSADADVVFLGLQEPEPGQEATYADRMVEPTRPFHTSTFVGSASWFAGRLG